MITNKRFLILIIFILLSGCGYKPIFSSNKSNFSISEIKFVGEKSIATKINNNLKIFKNVENKSIFYELEIYSEKKINILTKDSKGDPKMYNMTITIDLTVLENNEIKSKKKFNESFSYNNSSNKFSLKQYEKNIESNLIDKIVSKINLHLYSL